MAALHGVECGEGYQRIWTENYIGASTEKTPLEVFSLIEPKQGQKEHGKSRDEKRDRAKCENKAD